MGESQKQVAQKLYEEWCWLQGEFDHAFQVYDFKPNQPLPTPGTMPSTEMSRRKRELEVLLTTIYRPHLKLNPSEQFRLDGRALRGGRNKINAN